MWNNYLISMIRSYQHWSGLAVINMLAMVSAYGLLFTLIKGYMVNRSILLLVVVLLIIFVVSIAYTNFVALRLNNRVREMRIRKLLGAGNTQIAVQLLLDSVFLTGFLIVSGLVVAEIFAPQCGELLGDTSLLSPLSFAWQIFLVLVLVILMGVMVAIIPVKAFIHLVNKSLNRYFGV